MNLAHVRGHLERGLPFLKCLVHPGTLGQPEEAKGWPWLGRRLNKPSQAFRSQTYAEDVRQQMCPQTNLRVMASNLEARTSTRTCFVIVS